MGDAAQPRRYHLPQTARCRQARAERAQGAGPDAGAALDDQATGARDGRQAAGRVQARDVSKGNEVSLTCACQRPESSASSLGQVRRMAIFQRAQNVQGLGEKVGGDAGAGKTQIRRLKTPCQSPELSAWYRAPDLGYFGCPLRLPARGNSVGATLGDP